MTHARVALRLAGLASLTTAFSLAWAAGAPVACALRRRAPWRASVFHAWAKRASAVLGMRLQVEGAPPRGTVLLVSNHLSYVDVVLIAASMRCAFVAKSEVARWPVIGALARAMGTVFVDRSRKRDVGRVAAHMRARLAAGEALVLFPEGTSTSGDAVRDFRSSLLAPAADMSLPVHYAAIRYTTTPDCEPARTSVAWWGDMRFVPHFVRLLGLPSFDAQLCFGEEALRSRDRKALASELQNAVRARFVPMTGGASADRRTQRAARERSFARIAQREAASA